MSTDNTQGKKDFSDPKSKPIQQTKHDKSMQDENLLINDRYLLLTLLDNVPEYIYFKDTQSRFTRISKSLAKDFGLEDPSEAIGKSDYNFFSKEHAQLAFEDEQEIIRTGRTLSIEEKETWLNHPDTWVLTTKMPMYDQDGKIIGTFGSSRNITDRKIAEDNLRILAAQLQNQIQEISILHDQLTEQATHDPLTGLSNRRLMDTVLPQQFSLCQQLKQTFSIIVIDIDHFKNINDKYGHLVGDAMLEEYGKQILALTRADDFSCRFGGDEILIVFQKMSTIEAVKKAEIIRQKLGEIVLLRENQRVSTTVSIGIATFPTHGNTINELINRADEALYAAKEKGRNQIVLASQE
jgi:diguanylate cyclase (GGDEF)-like protein/PAS domain S-box-containing protein